MACYEPAARRSKGAEILALLGDASVQKQVLGGEWAKYCKLFGIRVDISDPLVQTATEMPPTASTSGVVSATATSRREGHANALHQPKRSGKRSYHEVTEEAPASSKRPKASKLSSEVIDLSD